MNISTGGPHILLFERDQQLAALLMSELQLSGYEGHTARTAVEVFDAIARYPVRLVLVNLAQAAAARREFWVALDTQRRGSSIQVLTFRCTNLAGYGQRDFEDHVVTADMEIDGMLGMMKLLDVIRARVPNGDINATTVPRMNRTNSSTSATASRFNQPISTSNGLSNNSINSGTVSRNILKDEGNNQPSPAHISAASLPQTPPTVIPNPSVQPPGSSLASEVQQGSQRPPSSSGGGNSQATYPEKIRAVIYPSQQRNWNANQEAGQPPDSTTYMPFTSQNSVSDTPVLQRLATGGESGLAQLTRMIQESQVPVPPDDTYVRPMYTTPTTRVSEAISSQSLRAAPIQDLPEERPVTSIPLSTDGQRRPEVLSRANYNQQSSAQIPPSAAQSSLTSAGTTGIAANSTSTSAKRETVEGTNRPFVSKDAQRSKEDLATMLQTALQAKIENRPAEEEAEPQIAQGSIANSSFSHDRERYEEQKQQELHSDDEETLAENAVILDILQSLPPMPAVAQRQAVQPQVLNGRATRSLGSVLLDGHLVPQERLEVAQNIQRMLRGVDLNYQLGEILLMFKLLTPDQLLAASLVSYGLITTTQISTFGRIRQELYSIGLEYDLENLLILFSILTPEQLREARANIQN